MRVTQAAAGYKIPILAEVGSCSCPERGYGGLRGERGRWSTVGLCMPFDGLNCSSSDIARAALRCIGRETSLSIFLLTPEISTLTPAI